MTKKTTTTATKTHTLVENGLSTTDTIVLNKVQAKENFMLFNNCTIIAKSNNLETVTQADKGFIKLTIGFKSNFNSKILTQREVKIFWDKADIIELNKELRLGRYVDVITTSFYYTRNGNYKNLNIVATDIVDISTNNTLYSR